ncbi:hypothetical protein GCM10009612_63470 [Streptomyces beijiangensis]
MRQKMKRLKDEADPFTAKGGTVRLTHGTGIDAVQEIRSMCRRIEEADNVQECRFPGSGRPYHGDELALADP